MPRTTRIALFLVSCFALLLIPLSARAAVGLLYFRAQNEGNGIRVSWATATELNTAGFIVYRGPANNGPWTEAYSTPARGDAVTGATYDFLDSNNIIPGAVYWYRLDDLDDGGNLTPHDPITIVAGATPTPTPTASPTLQFTPTPTGTATSTPSPTDTPTSTPTLVTTATPTLPFTPTPTFVPTTAPTSPFTPTPTLVPTATPPFTPTPVPAFTFTPVATALGPAVTATSGALLATPTLSAATALPEGTPAPNATLAPAATSAATPAQPAATLAPAATQVPNLRPFPTPAPAPAPRPPALRGILLVVAAASLLGAALLAVLAWRLWRDRRGEDDA